MTSNNEIASQQWQSQYGSPLKITPDVRYWKPEFTQPCVLFFSVLSVTRPKLPLNQILSHATCDVYSPKAVETLRQGQCYGYCLLYLCVKYIFFAFIKALDSKGNNKCAKKGFTSAMECADVAAFTFATWRTRSCLLCKLISAEATVINLFAILRIVLVVLGNEVGDQKEN